MPKPTIIVSYADTAQKHVGYIYQATNFIYTGLSSKFTDPKVLGMENKHHATYAHGMNNKQLKEKFGDKLYFENRPRKHRYIYFHGCSRKVRNALKYPIFPYPKGESRRYDDSVKITKQTILNFWMRENDIKIETVSISCLKCGQEVLVSANGVEMYYEANHFC